MQCIVQTDANNQVKSQIMCHTTGANRHKAPHHFSRYTYKYGKISLQQLYKDSLVE